MTNGISLKEQQDLYERRREWENKYNPINLRKEIDKNRKNINTILERMKRVIEFMLMIPQPEIQEWIETQYKEKKQIT